jgi:DNA anti-recombination protein RmuC
MGEEKYIQKELKKADQHYETSLKKLTNRIELKNLNIEKMKIVTGYVGVNINMTLSDGEKVVKAFTIIAEGTIQRPHYRYLVK